MIKGKIMRINDIKVFYGLLVLLFISLFYDVYKTKQYQEMLIKKWNNNKIIKCEDSKRHILSSDSNISDIHNQKVYFDNGDKFYILQCK